MASQAAVIWPPLHALYSLLGLFSHEASAILASLLFLNYAKYAPASGPACVLKLFPDIPPSFLYLQQISTQIPLCQGAFPDHSISHGHRPHSASNTRISLGPPSKSIPFPSFVFVHSA